MNKKFFLKYAYVVLILEILLLSSGPVFAQESMVNVKPVTNGTTNPSGTHYYPLNSEVTVTMTPNSGYIVNDVKVNNSSVLKDVKFNGTVGTYTFDASSTSYRIDITFKVMPTVQYTITVSAVSNGTITPGTTTVYEGDSRTFTISPSTGYEIQDVTVDGQSQGAKTSYSFTNINANHTISATFKLAGVVQHTITASAVANGTITPTGAVKVDDAASQTFTIAPSVGYSVEDVKVDNVSVGAVTTYTFQNVTKDYTIVATFKTGGVTQYSITATAGSNGTVTPAGVVTVNAGASQTYTITPGAGYAVEDVKVDSVSVGAVASYTFSNVSKNYTISATFKTSSGGTSYMIVASTGSNGTISPSGTNTVTAGSSKTFTMTPNSGYTVEDVKVDGQSQGALTTYTFTNITLDHIISVSFKTSSSGTQYMLVGSGSGSGGTISPSGTFMVNAGESKTFTLTPSDGYTVADLIVDGKSVGVQTSYTFSNVSTDHFIQAKFKSSTGQFTISASTGINGTIDPKGNITVESGGSKTFTIKPDTGYIVDDVKIDGQSKGAMTTYSFTNVTADHSIYATFKVGTTQTFTIRSTAGENGKIFPSGDTTVTAGESKIFSMTPNSGYEVADFLVDGTSLGPKTEYTLSSISAAHTVHVTFKAVSSGAIYSIKATSGANGGISPSGDVSVNAGDSKRFIMYMATGYQVDDVYVDDKSVGPVTSYTFSNVNADHEIHVTFKQISLQYTITASAGDNGSIYPSGEVQVLAGASKTFKMYLAEGYEVGNVFVDDVSVGPVTSYTFDSVGSNHKIHVTFISPNCNCSIVPGDTDGDGKVTLKDIVRSLGILSGKK